MARDHARVNIAIWGSNEFRALSPAAQHLYFVLVTSSTLNYAGVADWRPKRLAALSGSWTAEDVDRAAHELSAARVVIIDDDTEEVMVRTWMKHDGLIDQPRMAVSVANAYAGISSLMIRGVIVHELLKLKAQKPELKGWGKEKLLEVLEEPEVDPNETPVYPLPEVQFGANQSSFESSSLPQTEVAFGPNQTSPTPAPSPATSPGSSSLLPATESRAEPEPSPYPQAFEDFWNVYPKKADKRAALKAWEKATKRAGKGTIEAGAERYRDDPNREDEFTKNAATWLNADAWANEPLPDRNNRRNNPGLSFDEQRQQHNNEVTLKAIQGGADPWNNTTPRWQLKQ